MHKAYIGAYKDIEGYTGILSIHGVGADSLELGSARVTL